MAQVLATATTRGLIRLQTGSSDLPKREEQFGWVDTDSGTLYGSVTFGRIELERTEAYNNLTTSTIT